MPEQNLNEDSQWGMFSTHSSVTQLKPDTISECVQEAEEQRWALGDMAELSLGSHDQQNGESQNLGSMLLSQSTTLKKIHSYFSQLESRKCCLHLACQRSTFNSIRVVPSSRTVDDGSAKNNQSNLEVDFLENKELRVFKHAYLCSVYPVLAAPDPPSPFTPSPILHESGSTSTSAFLHRTVSFTSTGGGSSSVAPSSSYILSTSATPPRPLTPYSLHDSGVEESDEAGLIPMESICELLQRAFGLSRLVFRQYENLIVRTYSKKSSQRLLAEELAGQLAVLETNKHPFYSPKHFITQNGYDLWQKKERTHISELLNKFWTSSLPFPRDVQDLIAELHSVHEDYHILLKKLLTYENQFRQASDDLSLGTTFVPLSSASCRLLLEFGFRYGIGELFRKALLLQCLTSEFSPTVGYLVFMINLVLNIHQMLPSNRMAVVMVRQEFDILCSSLRVLKVQACKALTHMKSLFPSNKPQDGVELLLSLLRSVLGLMNYLAPSHQSQEDFEACLKTTVKNIFKPSYEMFKSVAQEDLNQRMQDELDPRLLNVLIQDIREDVSDYKTNFESTFEKFFSISKMAATSFYKLLMKDIEKLSQVDFRHRPLVEIDLRMLALAYRLNTLDSDWAAYVTPQEQTWRVSFLQNLTQWTVAIRTHLQNLVLSAVAGDAYMSESLNITQPLLTFQTSVTPFDCRSISFSFVSLSPSVNSAFNSIISSMCSTPLPENAPESVKEVDLDVSDDLADAEILDFGLTEYEMKQPIQKSKLDTHSLDLKEADDGSRHVSAHRRFSLPVRLDEVKSNRQFTINQQFRDAVTQHQTDSSKPDADVAEDFTSQGSATPTQALTPGSSVSDASDLDNHYESEGKKFKYPLLEIVSQEGVSDRGPSNFSEVLSMPQPKELDQLHIPEYENQRHMLRTDAPHSMSSRASSITPDWIPEDNNEIPSCTDPDMAFPHLVNINRAVMPVSGSAIDVIIMLQRLCYFCQNLVNVMFPEVLSVPVSRQSSSSQSHKKVPSSSNNDNSTGNQVKAFSVHEHAILSDESINTTSQLAEDGGSDFHSDCDPAQDKSICQEQLVSQISEPGSPELTKIKRNGIKLALHLRMVKAMSNMFIVYTNNMLCMDLCATPKAVAKRLVGPKLVEFVESQQVGGLVWGCRHQAEAGYDCLFYFNRKTKFPSDRHEPVTQHMCTRINNVFACLNILDKYHKKLLKAFDLEEDRDDSFQGRYNVLEDSDERRHSDVSEDFVYVSHHSVQDNSLIDDSLNSNINSRTEDAHRCWSYQSRQVIDAARQHMMAVLTGMCRLLAHKLNLFVKDGLYTLLHLKQGSVPVTSALAPVTGFLQRYLDSLSSWLYHDCFRRVLENLWVLIVQDIEFHANELRKAGDSASTLAHNWMLAISHLIRFMNNNGRGVKKELLLSQANDVIFHLQLFTLSTSHLIALFHSLRDYYFEGDHLTLEENAARNPPAIIHRIHNELQSLHKSFSGAELVHWIIKNKNALPADLSLPSDTVTKESAIIISQILLDRQFIVEVETECPTRNTTPLSFSVPGNISPYPQVIIHSRGTSEVSSTRGIHGRSDSCSSDSTIENSPDTHSPNLLAENKKADRGIQAQFEDNRDIMKPGASSTTTQVIHGDITRVSSVQSFSKKSTSNVNHSATISDFRSVTHQEHYDDGKKQNVDSDSDDNYFENTYRRHTPFSSLSEVTFNNNGKKFVASTKKFYLVHQSILHPGANNSRTNIRSSDSERNFQRLKSLKENLALIEQCFTNKVGPITIATIISGRKKSDVLAKNFVKQLPSSVLEKVSNLLDEPTCSCRTC